MGRAAENSVATESSFSLGEAGPMDILVHSISQAHTDVFGDARARLRRSGDGDAVGGTILPGSGDR